MIHPYMEPDSHAAGRPNLSYPIASLYFDSPTLRLHRETQEGQRSRFKLRIRCYTDDEETPVFFEIKRRHNMVVRKSRAAVCRDDMTRFLWGQALDLEGRGSHELQCLTEFEGRTEQIGALPVVSVSYDREAYMGVFDGKARITFDRNIRCRPATINELAMEADDWVPIEGRKVVLEMKFDGRLPHWMADVIHKCELDRTSYSKYSKSISRLGVNLMRFNVASH